MKNKSKVQETAAAGSVGAHSVAVRFDSKEREDYPTKKRAGLLDFLQKNKKIANGLNMREIKTPFAISIKEDVSLDQIYSKLGGVSNQSRMHEDNTQTYGVEDDEGNLMKITVRGDQQEEFETALAQELAEVEEYKMTGRGSGGNISMAEVLYNLKQNFDIVNVEFPEIPKDKVYNADKVSDPQDVDTEVAPDPEAPEGELDGFDDEGLENTENPEGDLEDVDFGDDEGLEGEGEEEEDLGTEFGEEGEEEESMLKKIISMLSSEAEARRAQYEAEAEKSRALQAKYSMKAAQEEMDNQEELARMETEMKQQKEKEKEAKKLADLARFKMRGNVAEGKAGGFGEFLTNLLELDDLDSEAALRMQRRQVQQIEDPTERRLYQQSLNAKRRILQNRKSKEAEARRKEQADSRQEQRQDGSDRTTSNVTSPNRNGGTPQR